MRRARFAARQLIAAIGVAVLLMAMAPAASASDEDVPPDRTALLMGAATAPTWNVADVEAIMNQFIVPTYPRQTIASVAVTTPQEIWPLTGLIRVISRVTGPPEIWGPGGATWPAEPWWKLSGLFDLTFNQSVRAGAADLEEAITKHGDDDLVIYGYSQGAVIADRVKRKLAAQYPAQPAPDIDFVLGADPNLPNGGLFARFPGLYIPILDFSFDRDVPTDTHFQTVVITRQYDFFSDFPLYPLNLVSLANAVLGGFYVHTDPFGVSLTPDATAAQPIVSRHGDTTYYFFETEDLPLFGPLRTLGVPEALIDLVEPFFRAIVELGYDRTIPPWEPTPARLIPPLNPAQVTRDLVDVIGGPAPTDDQQPTIESGDPAPVQRIGVTEPTPTEEDSDAAEPAANEEDIESLEPAANEEDTDVAPAVKEEDVDATEPTTQSSKPSNDLSNEPADAKKAESSTAAASSTDSKTADKSLADSADGDDT